MANSLLFVLFAAALAWMIDLSSRMPWGNVRPSKAEAMRVSAENPVAKLSLKYRTASKWVGIIGIWLVSLSAWFFGSTMNLWGWLSVGVLCVVSIAANAFSLWWLIVCRTRRPKR
jgi:hypothetical protein